MADQSGDQHIPPAFSSSSAWQQPTLPSSSPSPSSSLHYQCEHVDFCSFPELNSNRAMDASLFDMIRDIYVLPPQAAQAAPFAQPAIPSPPGMHPPMQTQPPAMATMQGSEYHGYLGAAPEHVAAHHAVLPDMLPPTGAAAKPASGRRRGRRPGVTAKYKPKPKIAKTAAAAVMPDQEQLTEQQQAATTSATSAWFTAGEEEVEEYADTSPPGVRFTPSDAEIIGYLRRKYRGREMPVDFIKEFNVFEDHPSTVEEKCGDSTNKAWYVFSPRHRKYKNGFRPSRSVGEVGYWKSNTVEAAVKANGVEIGRVNSVTFNLGRQPEGTPTPWKMKEYRISEYQLQPDPASMLLDPWVICKLFNADEQDQPDVPVQAGDQSAEDAEHADASNGSGGQDNVDGNQPPYDPEHELAIEDYLAFDDFAYGDPEDQ